MYEAIDTLLEHLPEATTLQDAGDTWKAIEAEADRLAGEAVRIRRPLPSRLQKGYLQVLMRKHLIRLFGSGVLNCNTSLNAKETAEYDFQAEVDKVRLQINS